MTISFTPAFFIAFLLFGLFDSFYLSIVKSSWEKQIAIIQHSPLRIRWESVFCCYLLLAGGLWVFILNQHRPLLDAFIFGMVVYGVYDTTNYATLRDYPFHLAIVDVIWGGVLTTLVTAATYTILSKF